MPDEIERWIRDLRHWNGRKVRAAVEGLVRSTDRRALDGLIEAVQSPYLSMHAWESAAEAVARSGDPRAVRALDVMLRGSLAGEYTVVERALAAVRALSTVDDPDAISVLAGSLALGNEPVQQAAVDALARAGRLEAAVGPLIRALGEPYLGGDRTSARLLAAVGAAAAVPVIRAVRGHYGLGMGYWADKIGRQLNRPVDSDRLALLAEPPALALLIESVGKEDPDARRNVIEGWVELGVPVVETLFGLLEERDVPSCLWAAEALGRIGRSDAVARFDRLLASAEAQDRLLGAIGLGYASDVRVLPILRDALMQRDPAIRLAAAGALGGLGAAAAEALPTLRRLDDTFPQRADRDVFRESIRRIEDALRRAPTELEAALPPEGRGTEPESAQPPAGRGTEPESATPLDG